MTLLLSLIEGLAGTIGSFLGAMSATDLANVGAATRRWLSKIGLALWPDVREPDDVEIRGRSARDRRRPPSP